MARLRVTKTVLAERRRALAGFRQALPSLRLKRQQLAQELAAAQAAQDHAQQALAAAQQASAAIPFASDPQIVIEPRIQLDGVDWHMEKRLGVMMPARFDARWRRLPYSPDATPPWFELALDAIKAEGHARLALALAAGRVRALERGLARAIQRVNLVEQRLEPEARRDVARISQLLSDGERTQLARNKLARRQVAARAGDPDAA